jgi:hypothetical protein
MKLTKNLGMLLLGIWLVVTGPLHVVQPPNSSHRYDTGFGRYCCWCFNPAWSVSSSVSPFAVLVSDQNRPIAL